MNKVVPPSGEREGGFYSFDAWGRRRNPANWGYDLTNQPELFAGRGFTSQ